MTTLVIKPLTPDLAADYYDFHENRAFSDHPEWSHCYCFWFHMSRAEHQVMAEEVKAQGDTQAALHKSLKSRAEKLIAKGTLKGYLAYADGLLVGWCNANDKAAYQRFDYREEGDDFICGSGSEGIKAVTCFLIAPECRGQGVATALLDRVIQDARAQGFIAVEGYARQPEKPDPYDFTGPIRLYDKAGFTKIAQWENLVVMRKEL